VHPYPWIATRDDAGCTRVVEVDVREHEMANVSERDAVAAEGSLQRVEAAARTAVDERRLAGRQQIGRDDPRAPQVEQIEKLEGTS
jgi:hypothetical protein